MVKLSWSPKLLDILHPSCQTEKEAKPVGFQSQPPYPLHFNQLPCLYLFYILHFYAILFYKWALIKSVKKHQAQPPIL